MDQDTITLTLLGMMAVTYVPRFVPMWLFASRSMPPLVTAWLRYVPMAVLAAMLFPSLVMPDGRVNLGSSNLFLWAALPATLVAVKTRSLFGSVIVGIVIVAVARFLLAR
jgi:branched-subunit amino acid transport protein